MNAFPPDSVSSPDKKFGKSSFVLALRDIFGTLLLLVSFAFLIGCFLLFVAGALLLLFRFLNRFFEPSGKNFPFASLGSFFASALPRFTLFADFRRDFLVRFFLRGMNLLTYYQAHLSSECGTPKVQDRYGFYSKKLTDFQEK